MSFLACILAILSIQIWQLLIKKKPYKKLCHKKNILDIPNEILIQIIQHLKVNDLYNFAVTNKKFAKICLFVYHSEKYHVQIEYQQIRNKFENHILRLQFGVIFWRKYYKLLALEMGLSEECMCNTSKCKKIVREKLHKMYNRIHRPDEMAYEDWRSETFCPNNNPCRNRQFVSNATSTQMYLQKFCVCADPCKWKTENFASNHLTFAYKKSLPKALTPIPKSWLEDCNIIQLNFCQSVVILPMYSRIPGKNDLIGIYIMSKPKIGFLGQIMSPFIPVDSQIISLLIETIVICDQL